MEWEEEEEQPIVTGKTSGGQAPSGGGEIVAAQAMGLQLRMQEAQIKNIEADTKFFCAIVTGKQIGRAHV